MVTDIGTTKMLPNKCPSNTVPIPMTMLVQESAFADGTRIVANLSETAQSVDGIGQLEARSYRVE